MTLPLRWTERATEQLGAIAEYISISSPVYADQTVERIVSRLRQAQAFPESGRRVPEIAAVDVRELIEPPYHLVYRVRDTAIEVLVVIHSRQNLTDIVPG